jgi:hypothetical protein
MGVRDRNVTDCFSPIVSTTTIFSARMSVDVTKMWGRKTTYKVSFLTPDGQDRVQEITGLSEDQALEEVAHLYGVTFEMLRSLLLNVRELD